MELGWLLQLAEYITALGIVAGVITKIFNKLLGEQLRPLHNRDRKQLRQTIVSFASDLHKGQIKTRDEFLSIFDLIDEYNMICKELKIQNHLFEEEVKYINKRFSELDILKLGTTR